MPNEVRVKRVSAYPIPVALATPMGPAEGQILKLTLVGFMAELKTPFLQVGEKITVAFETPVFKRLIQEQCVVIKLYNQWKPPEDEPIAVSGPEGANTPPQPSVPPTGHQPGTVQHIAEIHFKPLTQNGKKAINEFLKRIHGSNVPTN